MFEPLVGVVVIAGFFIGGLLAKISPEEMKPGRVYFVWLLQALALLITASIVYYSNFSLYGIALMLMGMAFGVFIREYYLHIGMAVAASLFIDSRAIVLIGALTFIFSIVHGTLSFSFGKFTLKRITPRMIFFALPFLMLLVDVTPGLPMSFALGAFASSIIIKPFRPFRPLLQRKPSKQ